VVRGDPPGPHRRAADLRFLAHAQAGRGRSGAGEDRRGRPARPAQGHGGGDREGRGATHHRLKRLEKIADTFLVAGAEADSAAKELRAAIAPALLEDRARQEPTLLQQEIRGKWNEIAEARPTRTGKGPGPTVTRVPAPAARLKPAERKVLEVIASKDGLPKKSVAIRARYKVAGHFDNMLGTLKSAGLIERRGDGYYATSHGRALVPDVRPLSPDETREAWRRNLRPSEWKLLEVILQHTPGGISKIDLATATDYEIAGHFDNMLGKLKGAGLIDKNGGLYVAAAELVG
jgi:hypothetical protein